FRDEWVRYTAGFSRWGPGVLSLGAALAIPALTFNRRIAVERILIGGLVFEVVGSFGIAAAQYLDVRSYADAWAGLSGVAIWFPGFTIIKPCPPGWGLPAALVSAMSVPVGVGYVIATQPMPVEVT